MTDEWRKYVQRPGGQRTPEERGYYTPEEAAERLGVKVDTIRKWCANGQFPGARQYGRLWRIPKASVDPPSQP